MTPSVVARARCAAPLSPLTLLLCVALALAPVVATDGGPDTPSLLTNHSVSAVVPAFVIALATTVLAAPASAHGGLPRKVWWQLSTQLLRLSAAARSPSASGSPKGSLSSPTVASAARRRSSRLFLLLLPAGAQCTRVGALLGSGVGQYGTLPLLAAAAVAAAVTAFTTGRWVYQWLSAQLASPTSKLLTQTHRLLLISDRHTDYSIQLKK